MMSAAKKADRLAAQRAAYKGPTNPFKEGSRLYRYFIKARQHFENMEAIFRDLESVYGHIGTRLHTDAQHGHEGNQ